jgi:hypothetical protein
LVGIGLFWYAPPAIAGLFAYSPATELCLPPLSSGGVCVTKEIGRKRFKASKLRLLQLGSTPDINEPLPRKPKWTRRRTYQRIRNEIQTLDAKAN